MRTFRPEKMSERDNYKFLIGSIIPRPIAVIATLSKKNIVNVAPFSYFNIVTSNPAIVSAAIQRKQGEMKDTARNILSQQKAVLHITDEATINEVNQTAANLSEDESELKLTNFTLEKDSSLPLIKELKIKMETELFQHIPIQVEDKVTADLFLLKVTKYHIEDDLYHEGRINADLLNPMSRLAGNDYATLGKKVRIKRPE